MNKKKSESPKQTELNNLISVVRALVISRKHQPCLLNAVLQDYSDVENRELPYEAFNYRSPEDLLSKSGQFHVKRISGKVYITAISNEKSAHIANFVREQNYSGREKRITQAPNAPSQSVYRKKIVQEKPTIFKNSQNSIHFAQILQAQHEQYLKEKEEICTQLRREFNELRDRLLFLENKSNVQSKNIDLVTKEVNKAFAAELRSIKDNLKDLSWEIENTEFSKTMIKSPEKIQTKGQSQQQSTSLTSKTSVKNLHENSETQHPIAQSKQNHVENISRLSDNDLRHRLNAKRSQKEMESPSLTQSEDRNLRPILGQQNNVGNQFQKYPSHNSSNNNSNNNKISKNSQQPPKQQSQKQPFEQNAFQSRTVIHQDLYQPKQEPVRQLPKHTSVQNRLKLKFNCDKNANGNMPTETETSITVAVEQAPPTFELKTETTNHSVQQPNTVIASSKKRAWKFDPKFDPITSISLYCSARKFGVPKYNVFKSKQGLYECQLIINTNTIYSTYPQEYTSETKARTACAEKAIQQIQIVEARNLLPTFPNDKEFLYVLYKELLEHQNGIISDKMPEWFVDKFGYTMPEHWFMLLSNSPRFIIEDGIKESTFIILANKNATNDYDDLSSESVPEQMEPLKLPWTEKSWVLFITHCVSTTEIWACLFGSEYSQRFESLTAELYNHMSKEQIRPDVIAPKHIYLVERHSSWQRVRVESLDKEKQSTFCFYIDFGHTEHVPVNELYLCDPKFLCLPPQAVPFSLFGLDDLTGNPYAMKYLQERLFNKAVIGELSTKKAEFEVNGTIQVVMFDTSTDDDINLNLLLQEEICKKSLPPRLRSDGKTSVNITSIDRDSGDVSLQIINADSDYVRKMINQIAESKLNTEQHNCSLKELRQHQLLLVCDDNQSIGWCRAKLIDLFQIQNISNSQDKLVDVLYIDYNIKRRAHISKIYRLESLSSALSKFPAQAVRVKLFNIPEFSQHIIGRMHALLPENCQALVRVDIPGDVPQVTIFTRVNGPDMPFCNINDALRLEIERTKDATLCLKDSPNGSVSSIPDALQSPTQLFRSLTLTPAMLPLKISELPKLREYNINLPLNATFFVNVILVSNPLSFTVQPYNDDFERLLNMMKQLQEYCIKNDVYIPADMVEIGQAYAAKKEDNYYRVIAKSRYGEMINVSFCDYGDMGTIRSDHLKVLPAQFRQLPIMGINASLYGIKRKTEDVWSTDDVKRFRDLVLGKQLASFIKGFRRDEKGTLELSLDLVDVQGDDDINIREILLNEKRALPTTATL